MLKREIKQLGIETKMYEKGNVDLAREKRKTITYEMAAGGVYKVG